ncbi:MAG: hypothetical protein H6R26_3382 [Proteobacteria bacterium]|nr:hypothetical protein [Pseudomonadota bacterium]
MAPDQPVFAHGTGAHPTPTPSASPKPLSPGAKLLKNVVSTRKFTGASGYKINGKSELVNQVYSDETQRKYLLTDIKVRLPNARLGLKTKADAANAKFMLRYAHDGEASPYAECTLDLRKASKRQAIYSLGMKNTSVDTLVRWGSCDNPQSPGFDQTFPFSQLRDTVTLVDAKGNTLAQFAPPVSLDVPVPGKKKKQASPAAARLMEKGAYHVKIK